MGAHPWISAAVMAIFALTATTPVEAQLRVAAEQGSSRSLNSQAVTLTSIDGVPASISAITQRPFVTSFIPVVGDYGGAYSPTYGPLSPRPLYVPGPSVVQTRIARMRQEGLLPLPGRESDYSAFRAAKGRSFAEQTTAQRASNQPPDFQSRLAAARKSSAGKPVESIAAIRRRQQNQDRNAD